MTTATVNTESTLDGAKSILRSIWAAFLTAALAGSFVDDLETGAGTLRASGQAAFTALLDTRGGNRPR